MPLKTTPSSYTLFNDQNPIWHPSVEALYDRAFGPGRHAKAAGRLREGNQFDLSLSFVAFEKSSLVGACRLWPIMSAASGARGQFLGPVAVETHARGFGLGQRLVRACLNATDQAGQGPIILVGDISFFGDFGFEHAPPGQIEMPGPVDKARLLVRGNISAMHGQLQAALPPLA